MAEKIELSERDRSRFTNKLRASSEAANDCIEALEAEDDEAFLLAYLIYSMMCSSMDRDIKPITLRAMAPRKEV